MVFFWCVSVSVYGWFCMWFFSFVSYLSRLLCNIVESCQWFVLVMPRMNTCVYSKLMCVCVVRHLWQKYTIFMVQKWLIESIIFQLGHLSKFRQMLFNLFHIHNTHGYKKKEKKDDLSSNSMHIFNMK